MAKNYNNLAIDVEYQIQNYTLFINDPPLRGVAIYIINSIESRTYNFNNMDILPVTESVWCTFDCNNYKILIGNVYRNGNIDKIEFINALKDNLNAATCDKFDLILITGDFNFPKIDWRCLCPVYPECLFIESIRDVFLTQFVCEPTRHRINQQSNILDLVLCNDDCFIKNIDHLAPLGNSDHDCLLISLNIELSNGEKVVKNNNDNPVYTLKVNGTNKLRYSYHKGNYKACREEINSMYWDDLNDMSLNDAWTFFKRKLLSTQDK